MLKVIGVIGIISVFMAIILYSIGNLQLNRGLVQHVLNTTKDPYMHYICKVNGKKIKGRAQIDISWFKFDDSGYISFFMFTWTMLSRGHYIKKHEQHLIDVVDEDVSIDDLKGVKWK